MCYSVLQMEKWMNGKFIPTYLTLMTECRYGEFTIHAGAGKPWTPAYWTCFTDEFNKRVKQELSNEALANFQDFQAEEVVQYGKNLESTYQVHKVSIL